MSDAPFTGRDYARRHLRFGWWSLLVFVLLGLTLESFHGFKVRAYLDVSNDTRRLMWTLAHAHGTLLSLIHVLFGLSVRMAPEMTGRNGPIMSWCLIGASVLLPGGFFLGGAVFYGGDPGLGVLLVPIGATALMIAVFFLARQAAARDGQESPGPAGGVRPRKGTARR